MSTYCVRSLIHICAGDYQLCQFKTQSHDVVFNYFPNNSVVQKKPTEQSSLFTITSNWKKVNKKVVVTQLTVRQ